jgi:hypothetical protein
VALDELLHRDGLDALAAEDAEGVLEVGGLSTAGRVRRAGAAARLEDQGKPTCAAKAGTSAALSAAVEAAVGTPASRSACFIDGLSRHSHAVRTDVPGMCRPPDLRGGHGVRLDRGLEPVDPQLVLRPPHAAVIASTSVTDGTCS